MWQPKPSKGWVSNMFRMSKTLDVITLFHKPSISASVRVQNLLKQASAQAEQTATEDQAADHTAQNETVTRDPFELEVTEAAPTPDQLKSIFEYLGGGGVAGELVKGAASQSDALRKVNEDANAFTRPVVVDWGRGKAVVGDKKSEILKLLKADGK
ncbi:uncharacterized protein PV06_02783 [Exophiala oligosperma]|uniref:Thioredoxin-like fold domain-containing protein n=2 Tax=Chaetothyriales TaxID=34395 RepID=A0A0D2DVR7_9EURO|nr:uncharacterized protein PV06_02783 [Exophiala oligosperma]KIW47188.1 hypothetical protein PV06_02783 [Exophiala oligosperma]